MGVPEVIEGLNIYRAVETCGERVMRTWADTTEDDEVREGFAAIELEYAGTIRLKDAADAAHAEGLQLRGPQRAHTGRPEHVDALSHGPEDLLVPNRGNMLKDAVDDADRARPMARDGTIDVALANRCKAFGRTGFTCLFLRDGWPDENHGRHGAAPAHARARRPGT